jgi:hypothetical protein
MRGVAGSLESRFASMLASAGLYFSSASYSRFAISFLVYPILIEVLVLALYGVVGLLIVAPLALLQGVPFLLPAVRTLGRKRSVEAELPFFLIAMTVFSHESSPSL